MLQSFRPPVFSSWKFWEATREPVDAPSKGQTKEYQLLAATETEEAVPLEEVNEMGRSSFQEQFEKPEGRDGDAIAQVVAIVRVYSLRIFSNADYLLCSPLLPYVITWCESDIVA